MEISKSISIYKLPIYLEVEILSLQQKNNYIIFTFGNGHIKHHWVYAITSQVIKYTVMSLSDVKKGIMHSSWTIFFHILFFYFFIFLLFNAVL